MVPPPGGAGEGSRQETAASGPVRLVRNPESRAGQTGVLGYGEETDDAGDTQAQSVRVCDTALGV